jgi:hypothetical protein
MKLVGNYKNWIPEGFLDMILAEDGDVVPVYQPEKWRGKPEWDAARIALENAGYPELNYKFHQYTIQTPCIQKFMQETGWQYTDPILPHWCEYGHWWIVKYQPGDMQPMHFDPHIINTEDCLRYTMMLTDFEDGHIFTYDTYLLNDYNVGDLFQWPDPMILHGAANIGMKPRISLQLSFYNK